MFNKMEEWLDNVLVQELPVSVVAFCFNLYEDENNNWSMELIGTESFDIDDEDWACDEITDFGTRDNNFTWNKLGGWNEILDEVVSKLRIYLDKGTYADLLKSKNGIAVGFIDGDIEIIYSK